MPASVAAASCALAASKRANAALTSATSDSDSVSVLVRPPWVYVNAGLSCGSPAEQWQVGLPHLRRNVVRLPRSNQSLLRRGSVDIAHPLCRYPSLQTSPPQRKLELWDYAWVRASRRRQTAQQDVPSEEPHPIQLVEPRRTSGSHASVSAAGSAYVSLSGEPPWCSACARRR